MQRRTVDLPDPDGPMSAAAVPFFTSSDIPRSTSFEPNVFLMLRTDTMASSGWEFMRTISLRIPEAPCANASGPRFESLGQQRNWSAVEEEKHEHEAIDRHQQGRVAK